MNGIKCAKKGKKNEKKEKKRKKEINKETTERDRERDRERLSMWKFKLVTKTPFADLKEDRPRKVLICSKPGCAKYRTYHAPHRVSMTHPGLPHLAVAGETGPGVTKNTPRESQM